MRWMHWGGTVRRAILPLLMSLAAVNPESTWALDRVVFTRDDQEQSVAGRLVVSAQDGGVLVMTSAGVLWAIQPEEIVAHTSDEQ